MRRIRSRGREGEERSRWKREEGRKKEWEEDEAMEGGRELEERREWGGGGRTSSCRLSHRPAPCGGLAERGA